MTIFVEASAMVAIIKEEPECSALEANMAGASERLTSGIALWETARVLARFPGNDMGRVEQELQSFLRIAGIRIVPIGSQEAAEAFRAHARYGKGTGHAARLNMGDCFAYACAKTNNARLLYKGDDFSHTDMA